MIVLAGAACRDITPPTGHGMAGYQMAGFVARTGGATGAHDPLTVRALAVDDTAIIVADIIGFDAATSLAIRTVCRAPTDAVIVAATHTHGGPASMSGRLGAGILGAGILDAGTGDTGPTALWRRSLVTACVEALDAAIDARRPARLSFGMAPGPGIARNRRHQDGPVDDTLPVLKLRGVDGGWIAIVANYACHPVVLGGANRLWTADYPHYVREFVEQRHDTAPCLFLTGCAGDANTGHSARSSVSLDATPDRSFDAARRVGHQIGQAILSADMSDVSGDGVATASETVDLLLERRDTVAPGEMAVQWERMRDGAAPAIRRQLDLWIEWARTVANNPLTPIPARVTSFGWGDMRIVALPGEIFARTGNDLRRTAGGKLMIVGYADDNPGYIPPADDYRHGGYEIDEAHRFYGLPAAFKPGMAERLAETALSSLDAVAKQAGRK